MQTAIKETTSKQFMLSGRMKDLVLSYVPDDMLLNDLVGFFTAFSDFTRLKILSYLSAQARAAGSAEFEIPFSRQQMADYLSVDRSALSAELSRLKAEGLLDYHRNAFRIMRSDEQEENA